MRPSQSSEHRDLVVGARLRALARARALDPRAEVSRFGVFLLVGGTASLLNLAIVGVLTLRFHWTYLPAVLIATEAGVLLGFVLNDQFTFRRLAGAAGTWGQRCLRFHATYAVGQTLTIAIGAGLVVLVGMTALLAQAIAIGVITCFNFLSLRVWAYQSRRHRRVEQPG